MKHGFRNPGSYPLLRRGYRSAHRPPAPARIVPSAQGRWGYRVNDDRQIDRSSSCRSYTPSFAPAKKRDDDQGRWGWGQGSRYTLRNFVLSLFLPLPSLRLFTPWAGAQPPAQLRPSPPARDVAHRDGDGFLLPDQHDQPLAACDAGVEKVPLQHGVMLCEHRD